MNSGFFSLRRLRWKLTFSYTFVTLEMLRLIADGLSNAEIASRLFLSDKTVKSHVSNILGKLHLADR